MAFFLGIDAGGSHCRSRLVDETGQMLGTGETGPANARIGMEQLQAALEDVTRQATEQAGPDEAATATIQAGFGITGI